MIKIKISYEHTYELELIKSLLHGHVKKWKTPTQKSGKYNKAYGVIKGNK